MHCSTSRYKPRLILTKKTTLLKRALIRSSLAAEGYDQQLQILRTLLRNNLQIGELEEHLNQLDKAVLQAEENLQHSATTLATTLTLLTQQLQQLQPSKEILRELQTFEKNLYKQLAQPQNLHRLQNCKAVLHSSTPR